jgi:hypothetical protein
MGIGAARLRRASRGAGDMLVSATAVGVFFGTYAGADWTGTARYFGPYVPVASLLLAAGFLAIVERVSISSRRASLVLGGIAVLIAVTGGRIRR